MKKGAAILLALAVMLAAVLGVMPAFAKAAEAYSESVAATVPSDAPAFVLETVTAKVGDTFTVAIRTRNNTGIVSLLLDVHYDDTLLELIQIEGGDFAGMTFGPPTSPVAINWVDALNPNNTTNGVVALLTFRVKEDATAGFSAITLSYDADDVYDFDFNNVTFALQNGGVEIIEYIPGDVNDDGVVNNKDLGLLQRYVNRWDVAVNEPACDVTGDGAINNKDVGLLQRYINRWDVELKPAPPAQNPTTPPTQSTTTTTTPSITGSTTTGSTTTGEGGNTRVTDHIRDAKAWTMNGFLGYEDFTYQVQILGKSQYNRALLASTINKLKLGDTGSSFTTNLFTAEWPNHCGYGQGLDGSEPNTRREAANNVVAWLKQQMSSVVSGPYSSMDSFTRWQHYTAEAGYDYIGCEIGANVNAPQLSVAFTRGAAKQYNEAMGLGKVDAWFVDFSLWNWLGMINYSGDETMHRHNDGFHNNIVNHEYAGQSVSAARRAYYMAYMSGAQWLINEGGAESACYAPGYEVNGIPIGIDGETGCYYLSPHGQMNQEFYSFTQRNPERGITYVPFGIVIPRDHGLPYGHWMANDGNYEVFQRFAFTDGDWMIDNLFRLLYPNNYPNQNVKDDGKQQVNTPYGDTVDILTDQADGKVLNSYPVIILAGDVELTPTTVLKYTDYVRDGGTLVLNSAYTAAFPSAFRKTGTQGAGKVIVYGDNYKVNGLGAILDDLLSQLIPFSIDQTVEYIVNVKDGSWIVTLINNDGVSKAYDTAEVVDATKTKQVKVTYTGSHKVLEVKDWMTGNKLSTAKTQSIELAPGEIAVIEFVL